MAEIIHPNQYKDGNVPKTSVDSIEARETIKFYNKQNNLISLRLFQEPNETAIRNLTITLDEIKYYIPVFTRQVVETMFDNLDNNVFSIGNLFALTGDNDSPVVPTEEIEPIIIDDDDDDITEVIEAEVIDDDDESN